MRDETIAGFLGQLAARVPTPGGGATAAMHAAQAAALLGMVARYSDAPRYDAEVTGRVRAAADEIMDEAVTLAEADADAFGAVASAYQLPKATPEEQAARSAAIADALAGAARPPADVLAAARRLTGLAEDLLPNANRNVIADVAAAAEAARAAAVTAQVNIEVNLRGIKDPATRDELRATAASADEVTARADRVVAAVREEIGR
jgi:methenyltetrahydrofolate cyclohydrolase